MRNLCIIAVIIGVLGWSAYSAAQEQDRTGGGLSVMLGGSFCVENDDAKCTDVDPSFGFSVSAGYRIMNHIGLGLDFVYGTYDVPDGSGVDVASLGLLAGPMVFVPLDQLDLFVGVGMGWMRLNLEGNGQEANADGFGLGVQAGLEYRVVENLGLGVMFRFHFNFADELCDEDSNCIDVDDVAHNAMVGARISVYF